MQIEWLKKVTFKIQKLETKLSICQNEIENSDGSETSGTSEVFFQNEQEENLFRFVLHLHLKSVSH